MKFYTVDMHPKGDSERYRTDYYFDEAVRTGEALKCPKCGNYVSMFPSLPPYIVHLETWGDDFGDIAFGSTDILVSARFKDKYVHSGLRGLNEFEPAKVASHNNFGGSKGLVPEYFLARPNLNSARIDTKASGVEWAEGREPECDECLEGIKKRWSRVIVNENSWNGDDIFTAYGISSVLIVTELFFEWASINRFRNLILKPALQSGHDFYPWEE